MSSAKKHKVIPYKKKFAGKYYYTTGTVHAKKSIATWLVGAYRKDGVSARTVKVEGGYVIYKREK